MFCQDVTGWLQRMPSWNSLHLWPSIQLLLSLKGISPWWQKIPWQGAVSQFWAKWWFLATSSWRTVRTSSLTTARMRMEEESMPWISHRRAARSALRTALRKEKVVRSMLRIPSFRKVVRWCSSTARLEVMEVAYMRRRTSPKTTEFCKLKIARQDGVLEHFVQTGASGGPGATSPSPTAGQTTEVASGQQILSRSLERCGSRAAKRRNKVVGWEQTEISSAKMASSTSGRAVLSVEEHSISLRKKWSKESPRLPWSKLGSSEEKCFSQIGGATHTTCHTQTHVAALYPWESYALWPPRAMLTLERVVDIIKILSICCGHRD